MRKTPEHIRVRAAIRDAGYRSIAAFCRDAGIEPTNFNPTVDHPVGYNGELLSGARCICECLGALPEEIWGKRLLRKRDAPLWPHAWISEADQVVGEDEALGIDEWDNSATVERLMHALSPSQRDVIIQRYYGDQGRPEIAARRGVSTSRIQQLEWSGLRRMRKAAEAGEKKRRERLYRVAG